MIKASQVTLWRTITSRIQSRLSEQQTTATTKPVSRLYTIVVRLQLMIHTRRVGKYKFSFSFTLMYQIEFELRSHTHTPIDWGLDIWAHCVTVYTRRELLDKYGQPCCFWSGLHKSKDILYLSYNIYVSHYVNRRYRREIAAVAVDFDIKSGWKNSGGK